MPRAATGVRRIVVTGPECTGKTSLAQHLAEIVKAPSVPESARVYAEQASRPLTVQDVEPIAQLHIGLADAAITHASAIGSPTIVLDTDLVSTLVYAADYYAASFPWIEEEARTRLGDLYLLCDVDLPWVADGIRDRSDDRGEMFALFQRKLDELTAPYVIIRGDGKARYQNARRALTDRFRDAITK